MVLTVLMKPSEKIFFCSSTISEKIGEIKRHSAICKRCRNCHAVSVCRKLDSAMRGICNGCVVEWMHGNRIRAMENFVAQICIECRIRSKNEIGVQKHRRRTTHFRVSKTKVRERLFGMKSEIISIYMIVCFILEIWDSERIRRQKVLSFMMSERTHLYNIMVW